MAAGRDDGAWFRPPATTRIASVTSPDHYAGAQRPRTRKMLNGLSPTVAAVDWLHTLPRQGVQECRSCRAPAGVRLLTGCILDHVDGNQDEIGVEHAHPDPLAQAQVRHRKRVERWHGQMTQHGAAPERQNTRHCGLALLAMYSNAPKESGAVIGRCFLRSARPRHCQRAGQQPPSRHPMRRMAIPGDAVSPHQFCYKRCR
jgi:hypothetical protein